MLSQEREQYYAKQFLPKKAANENRAGWLRAAVAAAAATNFWRRLLRHTRMTYFVACLLAFWPTEQTANNALLFALLSCV